MESHQNLDSFRLTDKNKHSYQSYRKTNKIKPFPQKTIRFSVNDTMKIERW